MKIFTQNHLCQRGGLNAVNDWKLMTNGGFRREQDKEETFLRAYSVFSVQLDNPLLDLFVSRVELITVT